MNEKKISGQTGNRAIIHNTVEFDKHACIYYQPGTINQTPGYIYQQVVSEPVKVPATKTESEKVTNMVGTFLNEGGIRKGSLYGGYLFDPRQRSSTAMVPDYKSKN